MPYISKYVKNGESHLGAMAIQRRQNTLSDWSVKPCILKIHTFARIFKTSKVDCLMKKKMRETKRNQGKSNKNFSLTI
jgi:hypothetical protein